MQEDIAFANRCKNVLRAGRLHLGNLTIGGALAQGVSGGSGGGNATFGGQVHAQGDVTAGGISLQGHTHTEQGDGAPTSVAR